MAKNQESANSLKNEALNKKEAFFFKNKKLILGVVAAIIVVIAGLFIYEEYVSGPREDKASTALARGQEFFQAEQFEKALNGDGAGYAGFVKIASDYSSTDAGNLANLYAGLCCANLNKWQDAVKYLEAFSPADDAMVSSAAVAALGNAYAQTGNIDKAVSTLKKAASMADSQAADDTNLSISPSFLLQAGQLLESQNKKAEALKIYQEIKEKYVASSLVQSQEIDKYIERVSQ